MATEMPDEARPTMESYKYISLRNDQSIRLIHLQPGDGDGPLVCKLQVHQFNPRHSSRNFLGESQPNFEALSYVWGSGKPTHSIQCNGENLKISERLHDVLCRVRSPRTEVVLWADGICINQHDLMERKKQVAMMREIYGEASRVLIFIRPQDSALSEKDAGTLARYLSYKSAVPAGCRSKSQAGAMVKRRILRSAMPAASSPFWRLLALFFDNPWFSRIWMIQEVSGSSQPVVFLGSHRIDWDVIDAVAAKISQSPFLSSYVLAMSKTSGLRNLLIMTRRKSFASRDPIPSLLQLTRDFQASDPRDKVYALLHMPLRRTRMYTKPTFLGFQMHAKTILQASVLLCLWSVVIEHDRSMPGLLFKIAILTWITHRCKLVPAVEAVILDLFQRYFEFCVFSIRLIRMSVPINDTISSTLLLASDYSYTAQTVYKTVARKLILQSGSLNVLSYVQHGEIQDAKFPSWVPRWDIEGNDTVILGAYSTHQWEASGNLKFRWDNTLNREDHLALEGLRFSPVAKTSRILHDTDSTDPNDLVGCQDIEKLFHSCQTPLNKSLFALLTAESFMPADSPNLSGQNPWTRQPCFGRRQFVTDNGFLGLGLGTCRWGILFAYCLVAASHIFCDLVTHLASSSWWEKATFTALCTEKPLLPGNEAYSTRKPSFYVKDSKRNSISFDGAQRGY